MALDMMYTGCATEKEYFEYMYDKESDVLLAWKMELFEVINEIEYFKFWKKNKKNNLDKIAEELGDAMCFGMCILNLQDDPDMPEKLFTYGNLAIETAMDEGSWQPITMALLHQINTPNYFAIMQNIAKYYNLDLFECHDQVRQKNLDRFNNGY